MCVPFLSILARTCDHVRLTGSTLFVRAETSLLQLLSAEGDGVASVLDDPFATCGTTRIRCAALRARWRARARGLDGGAGGTHDEAAALQKAQETLSQVTVLSSSPWAGVPPVRSRPRLLMRVLCLAPEADVAPRRRAV